MSNWSELNCNGTETSADNCLVVVSEHCPSDEAASVICQGSVHALFVSIA